MRELQIKIHRLDDSSSKQTSKSLLNEKQQQKSQLQCRICDSKFARIDGLKSHISRVHEKQKPYKCQHCPKHFFLKHECAQHERTHTGEKLFKCESCAHLFTTNGSKSDHIKRVHNKETNFQCKFCGKSFYGRQDQVQHERIHCCSYCSSTFNTLRAKRIHLKTHVQQKIYKCQYCGKVSRHPSDNLLHEKTHTGEKPYQCNVCCKSFTRTTSLNRHISSVHNKLKPVHCGYCNKSFAAIQAKDNHEKLHLQVQESRKIYECAFCDMKFTTKTGSSSHLNRVHLKLKPYKCKYCSTSFGAKETLERHERRHTGARPYNCSYCSKSFKTSGGLSAHIRAHLKEKTNKCDHCDETFIYSYQKYKHIKMVHHLSLNPS